VISNEVEAKAAVFTVVISEKGGAERRECFDRSELSVGRVQGNDLMLPKGNVSKRHARLLHRDGRFIVTDLNSTNGTYVNRRRISQATIVRAGDRVFIGDFVLRIEAGDDKDAAASEPLGSSSVPQPSSSPQSVPSSDVVDSEQVISDLHVPEADESGPSYPRVPGPPKMPSGARLELTSDASSSGRMPIVEPRPSLIERIASSAHEERVDEETAARRRVLARVVEGVKVGLGPSVLPEQVEPALRERILRAIAEQLDAAAKNGAELSHPRVRETVQRAAEAELMELGPLTAVLEDPAVTEITVAKFDHVSVQRDSQLVASELVFSSEEALGLVIRRLCLRSGAPASAKEMVIERRLPDGTKLTAVVGAAAPAGALLALRRPRRVSLSLEELVRRGTISRAIASFLQQCMAARVNVLVVGAAGGGAASLLSALCSASGEGRVVAVQEFEDVIVQSATATRLSMPDDFNDAVRVLRVAAAVPQARLLVELSNRDTTVALMEIIGEGIDGVLAAVKAPNLRRALARLPADIVAARPGMNVEAAREWIASSFDIVIEISRLRDGRQRVLRVSEIVGASEREIQTQDVFTFAIERTAAGGSIEGTFSASGVVPRVAEEMRARGMALERALFTRPPSR
jgi:pilus assembly protein CpaF